MPPKKNNNSKNKKKVKKRLEIYYRRRDRCKIEFRCNVCDKILTSRQFDAKEHAASCLGLDNALQCVWCEGNVSWKRFQKGVNVNHLLECFENFINKISRILLLPAPHESLPEEISSDDDDEVIVVVVEEEEMETVSALEYNIRLDSLEHTCEVGDFFGRPRILTDSRAYNSEPSFYPLEFDEEYGYNVYRDENLNVASDCVKLFLEKSHEFYHCMVRAVAFKSFIRAMQNDGRAKILPFSCWCEGGSRDLEDLYRHHRHMIIVYSSSNEDDDDDDDDDEGEQNDDDKVEEIEGTTTTIAKTDGKFRKNIWSKIKITREERPHKGYQCRFIKPIESAMHLVNTIGYVSNRRSRCNGTFDKKNRGTASYQLKHFCIFASLPENYRLPLVMQWEGGLTQLVSQIFKYKSPVWFARAPSLCKIDGMWHVDVKDLPDLPKGIVLPLQQNVRFVFEHEMTEEQLMEDDLNMVLFRMHGGDRKTRTIVDPSLEELQHEEWLAKQAERGLNVFWDGVGEEKWKFGEGLQKSLEVLRIQEAEHGRILEEKEAEHGRILEEKEMEFKKILEENEKFKIKCEKELDRLNDELSSVKDALSSVKEQYDRAINSLNENREEMERMRTKMGKLQSEVDAKCEEIAKLNRTLIIFKNTQNVNFSK